MEPHEYDVVVCHEEQPGSDLPNAISAGLTRRGFRVFLAGNSPADAATTLQLIEETPDFVVLLTAQAVDGLRDRTNRMRLQIAHALATDRNIVPVYAPGFAPSSDGEIPREVGSLDRKQPVKFAARASDESIARIAHRLSSDASVDDRQMLRQAKWIGSFVGLVLVALIAVAVVGFASRMFVRRIDVRPLPPLVLRWTAFGQRNDSGRWIEFAVRDGGPMQSGDQLRVAFSPSADGYAYVVSRDTRGDINVLFPTRSLKAASRVKAGQVYQAPADGSWIEVEGTPGVDRLYVIASYDPIENLESLVDERDEEATVARAAFLDSTIAGLLDGRHGGAAGRVRTRSGRPIADNAVRETGATSASLTLSDGRRVSHALLSQEGLVSAMAELRLRPDTSRR